MKLGRREWIAGSLACAAMGPASAPAGAQGRDWESRLNALLPTPEEDRWLGIPWRVSLPEAIAEATRAGRPIMAWVMNGNPLGCG